jgi:DNA ligase D-like protein (predicted ligase)
MPVRSLAPMLATSAATLPEGPLWTYEVKWDGYRALAVKDGARLQLLSRNHKDLTRAYPTVAAAVNTVRTASVVLDGEIVAIDAEGRPSFQALQHRSTAGLIVYYAFDVLTVGKESLLQQPLAARRRRLKLLTLGSGVLVSEPLPGSPSRIEREVRRLGLEGVVAKRKDSPYRPGQRTDAWVKVKFNQRQEFVIGGFKPNGSTFESILVGYYENNELYFAGKVLAGLTPHLRTELSARIRPLITPRCPFVNLPNDAGRSHWGEGITAEDMAKLQWVKPEAVVEVAFVEWTRDGLLRHPRFVGTRDDKTAGEVRRERTRP